MTRIQQLLFELDGSYLGHPYFVTGNALYNAVARRVDGRTRRAVNVSHGVFVPGEYGEYPGVHSQSGYAGKLGQSLPAVETYDDLFVFRDAAHRWLLESRPRDAHNTLDIERHGNRLAFAPACYFGKPPEQRNSKRSLQWFLHCYLHTDRARDDVLPLAADVLDGLRVGGARNYGFGELSLADSQVIDLDALDYGRLMDTEADAYVLELVSPYVLSSECPDADSQSVPWWWATRSPPDESESGATAGWCADGLRRRETRLVDGDERYRVATVDHGQVVGYAGDDVLATAKNGVTRVGTHAKYGFGELRVRPAREDRVPERGEIGGGDS
ncbi:hypothetical protein [Natranaeroarchaeum sulfidigenes]|uniref:Uncharacterized protein n=1 Tax=Natranaeroarchaeum sulfidigenes TaxID=2784880 RepID=A0A897MR51_9EURY|nr:hypothetical protein [Natranaeroarchaeum sulfidigenes]QSG02801.1 Uncharacterized protein AArcS_1590 [Natranaeroarchaeum sulfidigenes]